MTKTLKGIMVAYGIILVLTGLASVIVPEQISKIWNISDVVGYAKWFVAALGAVYVAAGVWLTAAGWNPVPQTHWVKFAITKTLLSLAVTIYAIMKDFILYSTAVGLVLGVEAVFAILFLAFYPWRSR
jgi:uncharacterized protein YjeT (DUF2065 family)